MSRLLRVAFDRFPIVAALLLAAGIAASCQGQPTNYLQHGIGSQLPAPDIERSSGLLNAYFEHLCAQSGLGGCPLATSSHQNTWNLVVRQGMNDIDRRCDAYLQWLDDMKRSRGPLNRQIADVRTATTSIMFAVDPNSAVALQVVGWAFDLISRTLDNYHSRLILEIESSTINAIVLRSRHDFRVAIRNSNFETRPDAEYALRSYLRLCLPFAIETNINDYGTLGAHGIPIDDSNTINDIPVADALKPEAPVGTRPPRQEFRQDPRLDVIFKGGVFVADDLVKLQRVICLQGLGIGAIGPRTRAGVEIFEETQWNAGHSRIDGKIDRAEIDLISGLPDCDSTRFRNYFERTNLDTAQKVKVFIQLLNRRFPDAPLDEGLSLNDEAVRQKIAMARLAYGLRDYGGVAGNQATRELDNKLRTTAPPA